MLIVPDIQDVYTPLKSDVIVQLAEVHYHIVFTIDGSYQGQKLGSN